MGSVESSFLFSSKWIQTAALEGNTFHSPHVGKENNSLKSPVSHTQHLYLPTFISSTIPAFLVHLSFHPHAMGFVLCVINTGFALWNHNREGLYMKAKEDKILTKILKENTEYKNFFHMMCHMLLHVQNKSKQHVIMAKFYKTTSQVIQYHKRKNNVHFF